MAKQLKVRKGGSREKAAPKPKPVKENDDG